MFVNIQDNRVLDVISGKDKEGQQVIAWKRHGGANQRWKVVYLDKAPKEQTKGMNEEFGFWCQKPFYLRSRLPMKRVAECHGANNVWLRRWRKNTIAQQFFFDCTSKTIRSQ
jgi:hypothetical protein